MAMREVKFRIVGLSPILMNNPSSMQDDGDSAVGTKKVYVDAEEAEKRVYRCTGSRQLYIPSIAFRSAILGKGGGATGRKIGKKAAPGICAAAIFNVDTECKLVHATTGKPIVDYELSSMRVVIQMKNAVKRVRPQVSNWACILTLEIDDDFLSIENVVELLNISGRMCGVMDYRPARKGPFGRFRAELAK